jgi:hypothetical protein
MIRITDDHGPRLLRVTPARVIPAMGEELEYGARTIAEDAKFSIMDGAISGPGHIPSLPGHAPSADTHALDQSIHVGDLVETLTEARTAVIADSDHAWIERGGSRMEPRPYLEPATEGRRGEIVRALGERYRELLGG